METANSSKTTADSANLYSVSAAESHEAGNPRIRSPTRAEESASKTLNGKKRFSENLPQPHYKMEVLGYLD